jgi:hypothetical protein
MKFLLWCNAIVFAIYLAGHLFDILIIIPNWKSGSIEEIILFNDFFHKTNPVNYYRIIMWISTVLSVLCFVVAWPMGNPVRTLLGISLVIDILIDIVTWHYFTPINEYLFLEQGGELQQARVREYVTQWVVADYLRVGLIMIGFYTSILAVHFSYKKR